MSFLRLEMMTYLCSFIKPRNHYLTPWMVLDKLIIFDEKYLMIFDEFIPSFPGHFKFFLLYEVLPHNLTPYETIFLRLFCPVFLKCFKYLYLLSPTSLQSGSYREHLGGILILSSSYFCGISLQSLEGVVLEHYFHFLSPSSHFASHLCSLS